MDVEAEESAGVCASMKSILAQFEARRNIGLIGDMDRESIGHPVCLGGKVERGFGLDSECGIVGAHSHINREYGFWSLGADERLSRNLPQRR